MKGSQAREPLPYCKKSPSNDRSRTSYSGFFLFKVVGDTKGLLP